MAIQSLKELNSSIKKIGSNANVFRGLVHEALVACAYHSAKDGQITPFNDLLEAVGAGTRKAGIVLWAETYGFVRIEKEVFVNNKESRKGLNVTCEADFQPYVDVMNTSPHWADMVKKEPVKSMFDVNAYLTKVLEKLAKEGSDDVVPYLEEAINKYKAVEAVKALKALENQPELELA